MKPTQELREYLGRFATRCKAVRWFGASFHVGVCEQIAADVQATEEAAARKAYAAEQADREAMRLIEEALSDGKLDASDLPRVRRALANVQRSAATDRELCDVLTP